MGISILNSITNSNLKKIHESSLKVLEKCGVGIADPYIKDFLIEKGCWLDQNQVVHFPNEVIEQAIKQVPKSYIFGSKSGSQVMTTDSLHFRCQSGCINILDNQTGICRQGTIEDVEELTKIIDKAENLTVVSSLLYPWDIPVEDRDVATVVTMLKYSSKHIYVQPYHGKSAEKIARVVAKAGGTIARPYVTFITSSTSPLTFSTNELEILRIACEYGIPVMLSGTPICGATSPVTIAGQIVLSHAETLALFSLVQLLKPGSPITYGIRPSTLDMRSGNATWGDVEWGIATFVHAHLAHYLGFITDVVGFPTDSKVTDFQAGVEKGMNGGLISLAPCNMVAGCGFVETILTASAAQILLDNELVGMYKRIVKGISWDQEHMAVDLISRVGPAGNYLMEEHTLKFFREEFYEPTLFDRTNRENWIKSGSCDVLKKAQTKIGSIIKQHR